MSRPAEAEPERWDGPLQDSDAIAPGERERLFTGRVWDVLRCRFTVHGTTATRDVIAHPGAVVVVAVNDDEELLLIRQYRHPVGGMLLETPAGLLDALDEDPLTAAQRELAEEAGYAASSWNTLVDIYNSSGGSSEGVRIFLARGITAIPGGRLHTGEAEEVHLPQAWAPIAEVVRAALAGDLASISAVLGSLAAAEAQRSGWRGLRPGDAPWRARERVRAAGLLPTPR